MAKKDNSKKLNEIIGLCFFLIGIFTLASLVFHHPEDHPFFSSRPNKPLQNPTGLIGVYLSHYFLLSFGYSSYLIAAMAIFWSICHFMQKVPQKKFVKLLGFLFFLTSSSGLFSLTAEADSKALHGGFVGYVLDMHLERYFGPLGAFILFFTFLLLSLLLATDFFLFPIIEAVTAGAVFLFGKLVEGFGDLREALSSAASSVGRLTKREVRPAAEREKPLKKQAAATKKEKIESEIEKSFFQQNMPIKVKKYEPTLISPSPLKPAEGKAKSSDREKEKEREKPSVSRDEKPAAAEKPAKEKEEAVPVLNITRLPAMPANYQLPPMDLLSVPQASRRNVDQDLQEKSKLLEATLRDFDIDAKVIEIEQGPTVTRYELLPAPGIKVSSIVSLSDDLALALKATSIRIIAPIPGKSAVGIEVPNSITDTVYLRELLHAPDVKISSYRLPLTLGKDTSGKPLIAELTDMPHLLVAGATGSGKTVCLNAIIAGFLYTKKPDELKFVMIDPKMVEMAVYNNLPHMMTPVVTDVKKAAATLNWVVSEMENRYKIFASCAVRNIQGFNERPDKAEKPEIPERLPYIVVVIDELADLMMVAQDKVETAITRLAQLSRAVGIHLILATQRPSVDVITGVIKANFPARISFKVASKVDSRTVLDVNGADKLLGKGDMLFLEPGQAKPTRGQAAFITDREMTDIVKFIRTQKTAEYTVDLDQIATSAEQGNLGEKDELYDMAVKVVLETRQASTSILQRRLRLGYGRAARMLDMMEAEGIVGPSQGTRPREILVDRLASEA